MVILKIKLNLKKEYRANVVAQSLCILINTMLFVYTKYISFLWINISCIMFIGVVRSQPKGKLFDVNLTNHLIIVLGYYILYSVLSRHQVSYFCLIFIFTYIFYILKDSGFTSSVSLWTYIQSLMIATSLTNFPFELKLISTIFAYTESLLILFICFKLFPSNIDYVPEKFILDFKYLKSLVWFDFKSLTVKLAIRGAIVASAIYIVCVILIYNDPKPNWAVIVAVSCLMRDDDSGGKRSMISCAIGSLLGWIISILIIKYVAGNIELAATISWISTILGLIFIFEFSMSKTMLTQILSIVSLLVAITALYIALSNNSEFYLHLKIMNNMIGIVGTLISLEAWIKLKKYLNKTISIDIQLNTK